MDSRQTGLLLVLEDNNRNDNIAWSVTGYLKLLTGSSISTSLMYIVHIFILAQHKKPICCRQEKKLSLTTYSLKEELLMDIYSI